MIGVRRLFFLIGMGILCLMMMNRPSAFDWHVGRLPILLEGRVKPFDTVARQQLLDIQGRVRLPKNQTPSEWLLSMLTIESFGRNNPHILVEHPQLFDMVDPQYRRQKYRVSQVFLQDNISRIAPLVVAAESLEKQQRDPMQQAAYMVANRLSQFTQLKQGFFPYENGSQLAFWNAMLGLTTQMVALQSDALIHQSPAFQSFMGYYAALQQSESVFYCVFGNTWMTLPQAALDLEQNGRNVLSNYLLLADAFQANDRERVQDYAKQIHQAFNAVSPQTWFRVNLEMIMNSVNPFMVSLMLNAVVFVMVFLTRFFGIKNGYYYIHDTLIMALGVHTFGLVARMVILSRPPVINLYSSAIFIAYIVALIGWAIFRKNKALFIPGVTSVLSVLTLVVAYHLSLTDGDTLVVMQAVLNSNFWLGTHVVTMTIGYAIIFMAGFFAIGYILMGTMTPYLNPSRAEELERLVYIFLMISLFFNVLGTLLGGIWADQSWGRFWGWDPKENGAILIVLWTAIILHMKWGRLLSRQGVMVATVFSNIVTAWSWKGTNMLGIGLHAYGFTETTFYWLILFIASQLIIMVLGSLPQSYWMSSRR